MKNLLSVKLVTLALLAFMVVVPVGGLLTTPDDAKISMERRNLNRFPQKIDKDLPVNFGAYLKDRVLLRSPVIDLIYPMYIKNFREFDITPDSRLLKGKDDMWFLGNMNEAEAFQHSLYYPFQAVAGEIANWVYDLKYLQEHTGLPIKFFIVPDKVGMYIENMPPYANMGKVRLFNYFLQYAQQNGIDVYDAFPDLLKAKEELKQLLWFRNDAHWNLLGAYLGYSGLMRTIKGKPVQAEFNIAPASHTGDVMMYDLGVDYPTSDTFVAHSPAHLDINLSVLSTGQTIKITDFVTIKDIHQTGSVLLFENPGAPYSQTLLLSGDSTVSSTATYFAATFKKVIYISNYRASLEALAQLAKEYQADFIIFHVVERGVLICSHTRHRIRAAQVGH